MIRAIQNEYMPDKVSPPGETLLETLETVGMSQAELAERTGRPKKTINEIVNGKSPITSDTALQFERVLGVPARFWNERERIYQEYLARARDRKAMEIQIEWIDVFPHKEMVRREWIRKGNTPLEQLIILLKFFGVASPKQWDEIWHVQLFHFRKSDKKQVDEGALTAWLRRGEIEAQEIQTKPFEADKFKQALSKIRELTNNDPEIFQPQLVELAAEAGVAVVFVPEFPNTHVWGATRWLRPDKALIQLSLRYKTDDHLWFTFFHEAGHVLLHGKRDVFIESDNEKDEREAQANRFAANWLIPASELDAFMQMQDKSKLGISRFATRIGISPGIVVGRLQHEGYLPHSHCNELKRRFEWE